MSNYNFGTEITSDKPLENCPKCRKELTGTIEVNSAIVDGINIVVMEETSDRNWILCDFCNQTICKSCCLSPNSGYCNACLIEIEITPSIKHSA